MRDGYDCSGEGDCSFSWLDELLCEYVDGTMDPAVRRSFEEVLERDPELARQVEQLRCTRSLLCQHGCQMRAPSGVEARVRQRLAVEMIRPQQPAYAVVIDRLGRAAMGASAMAVVLLVGMLVGATWLADPWEPVAATNTASATTDIGWQERPVLGVDRAAMTPLPRHRTPMRRFTFIGSPTPAVLRAPAADLLPLHPTITPVALQRTDGAP